MIALYTSQLREVLLQYRSTMSDLEELAWVKIENQAKSKNNIYKEINLREIDNRVNFLRNANRA